MEQESLIELAEKMHVACQGCGEDILIVRQGKHDWIALFGRFFFCQNCTNSFFEKLRGFTSP